ncbi:helix-turn-helix domain-containing protein [Ruminococcaceae bacterium OttesenSCG-928-O06]|nr:helix-turn-helix domain-containing protein [Ruminococcaceae bacterium OttesenSCG-928-O06]
MTLTINDLPDVLTVDQLIEYLPIGRNNIYALLKSGVIKSIKVGRKYIIPKKYLLDFLEGNFYNENTHTAMENVNTVSFGILEVS